jgi:branched-chain amino acid transport system substrate-binding protein
MRVKGHRVLRAVAGLVVAGMAAACGSSAASPGGGGSPQAQAGSKAASKPPVVIGDLVTLTTANALTGKEEELGRQMAVKAINAAGGVGGRPIKLVTEDTAFDNQTAINALQKVLGAHPSAILGPVWSNEVLAMEPTLKKARVPLLFAGSAGLVTQQGNPWVFRDLTDVSYAEPTLAQWFLRQVHATRPAIIYSNDAFGISLKNAVLQGLKAAGVKPVTVQSMDDSATDITSQVAAIKSSGADALFGEDVSSTGALVLRTLYQQGVHLSVMMANPILAESVLKLIPAQALDGVYVESNYAPLQSTDPKVQAWVKQFVKENRIQPDWAEAINYGAVYLLAHVIGKYGDQPAQVAAGLRKTHYRGLFTTYYSDREGNLWHTDDVVRFGPNKEAHLAKELTVKQ